MVLFWDGSLHTNSLPTHIFYTQIWKHCELIFPVKG
jgi:hypothetical protein